MTADIREHLRKTANIARIFQSCSKYVVISRKNNVEERSARDEIIKKDTEGEKRGGGEREREQLPHETTNARSVRRTRDARTSIN